jgi:tetratricopeptide (TPR) repeat protein
MELKILSGELERLYELEELKHLSETLLGLSPGQVGGTTAKASFARALAQRCAEFDAVEALVDAIVVAHTDVDPRVLELRVRGFEQRDVFDVGDSVGPYLITAKLGDGRLGTTYAARADGNAVRLRVLWRETARDRRGLQRYFTHSRLIGAIGHPGLPSQVKAGLLDEPNERFGIAHELVEGQLLSERFAQAGKVRFRELRPTLLAILESLAVLHDRRIAHGSLRLENILMVPTPDGERAVLLDAGSNHVRVRASLNGYDHRLASVGSPYTIAPEQIRGAPADLPSDVYSFGAMLYELVSGQRLFGASTPLESLVAHLSREPEPLGFVTQQGWVATELDEWLLPLLDKEPLARPASARELIKGINALGRKSMVAYAAVSDEELVQRLQSLATNPWDDAEAGALEATAHNGANPVHVAEGFLWVAEQLHPDEGPTVRRARARMLLRAARLYENTADEPQLAEDCYSQILELDANDAEARAGLERTRKALGKHEDIVEELLAKSEDAPAGRERAEIFAQIGAVYAKELGDKEQALVAYTQAFCDFPERGSYAEEIERIAGNRLEAWEEILSSCMEAASDAEPADKHRIFLRMGRWYSERVGRPDLALPCFSAVLAEDGTNEDAYAGLASVYRKAQQWTELGGVLLARAESAAAPTARDLKAEAAEVAENQLGNLPSARDLYESIVVDDPGHAKAGEGLTRIYERMGDFERLARVLDQRAEATGGDARLRLLCRAAEVYDDHLRDHAAAAQRYEAVLAQAPVHPEAVRGLDRVYSKTQRYPELYANLELQLQAATTARQKIQIYERMAAICEEEFLDFGRAADACASIIELDPENDAALTALARHYRMLSRWDDVIAVYEAHLALLTDPERRLEKLLALGRVLQENAGDAPRAVVAYEAALEASPGNLAALEALAKLRTTAGDVDRAIHALDALAERASSPEARADQYVKTARMLDGVGRSDAALERYKAAVDANPGDKALSKLLREAYLTHGDASAAVELLERELQRTDVVLSRAKLSGEIARLCHEQLKDDQRAESFARRALDLDPTNLDALTVLGDVAYRGAHYREAVHYFDQVVNHLDPTQKGHAPRVFSAYVHALAKSGNKDKALWACDLLGDVATSDRAVLSRVAEVTFEHGAKARAFELYRRLVTDFESELSNDELAVAHYRLGESARQEGELEIALTQLDRAIELDPSAPLAYASLVKLHEARGDWHDAVRVLHHQLDLAGADERAELMLQIGEIAATKLQDPEYAAKSYLSALSERPDDRKVLMKLMQLYSEQRDWRKLMSVVLRLAELAPDEKQKAKYLYTAGKIAQREMGDVRGGIDLLDRALAHDPELVQAADVAIELRRQIRDYEGVKELLKLRIKQASAADDQALLLKTLDELADVYVNHLARADQAIAVLESAQEVDPDDARRTELLTRLYVANAGDYLDKAIDAVTAAVRRDPYDPELYKQLRQIYTEARRADGAWCACQALSVLGKASADELRFFERMRSEVAAPAQRSLSDRDWLELLMPAETEPLLTAVFALIQSSALTARSRPLEEFGYGPGHELDPEQYPYGMIYGLHYAAHVLGVERPPLYQDPADAGGLSFLNTLRPSIVLGQAALDESIAPQPCAFIAARHMTFYQSGLYVRQLLPNVTMLKAWLFGAIRLFRPQFVTPADVEVPAREAQAVLERNLTDHRRDHLTHALSRLLSQDAALDLKRWMSCIDLTADRAGFLLCHDLETAVDLIRSSGESGSSVPLEERLRDLVAYSVSPQYLELRQTLGIAVDS